MNDIDRLILEAWEELGPKIMADPDELAKRLARRRMAILTRPVRAWCIAVRASDTRITPAHWVIVPEHAMDLNHPEHPYEPIEHEVTIQTHALRKYCRPVRTDEWGEEAVEVAKKLGCSNAQLNGARWAGVFSERFVKGLGGKHGKPVPLIHSWKTLDPSGHRYFERPEVIWGSLWEFLPDMIPDDFEQTIIRKPIYPPVPIRGVGPEYWDHRFRGWRWVCPGCRRQVRTIYYPLKPGTLFDHFCKDPAWQETDAAPEPLGTFACGRCHGVRGRKLLDGWNQVVSVLTRGLLYGHEVKRPEWYRPERRVARHRKLGRRALKREAVLRRLLNGWTERQIALDLMMSLERVSETRRLLCRQERVRDRRELAAKLGSRHEQPLNKFEKALERRKVVERLLLEGLSYLEISRREGIAYLTVRDDAKAIYRRHGLGRGEGRVELASKMVVEVGGRYALRRELRRRLAAGESIGEIARGMGMKYQAAAWRCRQVYREEGVRGRRELMEKMGRGQNSEPRIQNSEVGGGMTNVQCPMTKE